MDIERKLASIRRVSAIDPIPNADNIVCLTVDGWKLVSQKDNFKVGDLCVYFEIDSFLPVRDAFKFLHDKCFKSTKNLGDGYRLKTIKLRGQVSQGLALPLDDLFEEVGETTPLWGYPLDDGRIHYLQEGDDVTTVLGVQKYEQPVPTHLAGSVRGNFPSFLRKTDQERVQNCLNSIKNWINGTTWHVEHLTQLPDGINDDPDALVIYGARSQFVRQDIGWIKKTPISIPEEEVAQRREFEATIKLDGSSMTVYHNEGQVGVCSRNMDLKRSADNTFWQAAIAAGLPGMLAQEGRNIALQGELMGPGVQGNRESFDRHYFFLFDVFDIDQQRYLTPLERDSDPFIIKLMTDNPLATDGYAMKHVPSMGKLIIRDEMTVDEFLTASNATSSINHKIAEGIVYKSYIPNGPSFKCISNTYLLKEEDK